MIKAKATKIAIRKKAQQKQRVAKKSKPNGVYHAPDPFVDLVIFPVPPAPVVEPERMTRRKFLSWLWKKIKFWEGLI
jgi:hypothetical protein